MIIQFQSGGFWSWSRVDRRTSFFQRSLSLPLSILCNLQPRTPPTQFYLNSLQLAPPYLLWPSSISLPIHFKHRCLLLNVIIISLNHLSMPQYSIYLCHFDSLIDSLISSSLSSYHEKATEALCVGRIQTRLGVAFVSKFSA